jgi:hypothetical protein
MQPRSFIDEVTQKEKSAERVDNIVFIDIDRVLYRGVQNDDDISSRQCFDGINSAEQERLICDLDSIKTHPHIVEMQLDPDVLHALPVKAVAAAMNFNKQAIANLSALFKEYQAKGVISSSWRRDVKMKENPALALKQIRAVFQIAGFPEYESIIGFTPILSEAASFFGPSTSFLQRGNEIESWLLDNWRTVKSYAILDDEEFNIPDFFRGRFVHCKTGYFASASHFKQACDILAKPVDDQNCPARLTWNAIKNNSVDFDYPYMNLERMTTLRLLFGYSNKTFLEELFSMHEKHAHPTQLVLWSLVKYHPENRAMFMEKLINLLRSREMKLEILNLSDNGLENIDDLLSVIDGKRVCVERFLLHSNPIEIKNQEKLSSWIRTYPVPLRLFMNISMSENVVKAVIENENIILHAEEKYLPENEKLKQKLFSQTRHEGSLVRSMQRSTCVQQ